MEDVSGGSPDLPIAIRVPGVSKEAILKALHRLPGVALTVQGYWTQRRMSVLVVRPLSMTSDPMQVTMCVPIWRSEVL